MNPTTWPLAYFSVSCFDILILLAILEKCTGNGQWPTVISISAHTHTHAHCCLQADFEFQSHYGYIAYLVVMLVWEVLPTYLIVLFFRVRIPSQSNVRPTVCVFTRVLIMVSESVGHLVMSI